MEKPTVTARTKKVSLLVLFLAALMTGGLTPAFAQEAEEDERAGLPDRDDSDPLFWAEMRDVYTIQQRSFLKEGRFAVSLYAGMIPNNIFEQYYPVGIRANWYVLENIGLEFAASYAFARRTVLTEMVGDPTGIGANSILLGDIQLSHNTFGVKWSPVYGKFAFNNTGLFYFDMFILGGAGLAVLQTESDVNIDASTTAKAEGVVGAGAAIYMGQHLGVRVDFRQFIFLKPENFGGVYTPSEVSLGASWFF